MKNVIGFMKIFFYINFFVVGFIGYSQNLQITGTKQFWASGICCNSGTNYVLKIEQQEIIDLLNSGYCLDSIFYDENLFFGNEIKLIENIKAIFVTFTYSINTRGYNPIFEQENVTNIGIKNKILLVKGTEIKEFLIGQLEELPYIPYP